MLRLITRNKQVTIPKEFIDKLHLHEGHYVSIDCDDDSIRLRAVVIKVYQAIDASMKCLDGDAKLTTGFGLKNWHGDYCEIRAGPKDRILFEFTDQIVFMFDGNHDEIKDFMKWK